MIKFGVEAYLSLSATAFVTCVGGDVCLLHFPSEGLRACGDFVVVVIFLSVCLSIRALSLSLSLWWVSGG